MHCCVNGKAAARPNRTSLLHTVTEPSNWFTEQDNGTLAGIVRNAQAAANSMPKDQQQQRLLWFDAEAYGWQRTGISPIVWRISAQLQYHSWNFKWSSTCDEGGRNFDAAHKTLPKQPAPSEHDNVELVDKSTINRSTVTKSLKKRTGAFMYQHVLNEWQTAADRARQYLAGNTPNSDIWFTDQDVGRSAE